MKKFGKLIAATKLQDYTSYYSENPQKAIWQELLLLTDYNVLKRTWETDNKDNYTYVSTSLNQAFEYYQASLQFSIKTKPLLLYYCFLNLTRGVLFVKSHKSPNSSYHGLAKPKIDSDILKSNAISNDGLFKDLLKFYGYDCIEGTHFTFRQFVEEIPELAYELKTYFDIDSKLHNLKVTHYIGGDIQISVAKELYEKNSAYQNLLSDFIKTDAESEVIFERIANTEKSSQVLLKENIEMMKKYCVFSPLEYSYYFKTSENALPIEASYYGAMFLLSSIVRYFPVDISKFTKDHGDHSAAWFINHFCETASRVYPNLMLNALTETQVRYS